MKMSDLFRKTSGYFKAADVDPPVTLAIAGVDMVEFDGDEKPALRFEGTGAKLTLNKTNNNTLVAMFGDDSDNWIGKRVQLYQAQTEFQGKSTPCVRVRPPQATKPPATGGNRPAGGFGVDDDELPF